MSVFGQCVSLLAASGAMLATWFLSRSLQNSLLRVNPSHLSYAQTWLSKRWEATPGVVEVVIFILSYLLLSAVLHGLIRLLLRTWISFNPEKLKGRSRLLGGIVGGCVGFVRATSVGALFYLAMQYFSLPTLALAASDSGLYQTLSKEVYAPWVSPWVTQELPVFESGALANISNGLGLFVIPTSSNGSKTGMLLVPKRIASLAMSLTNGTTNPTDKAYELYKWESTHIHYDWKKYDDFVYNKRWDNQSPLQTLETGKGVCADYALLYADLTHSVGLTVRIDEGIGVAGGETGPHAWNEIYDPDHKDWINVDTTWGSQSGNWFGPTGFSQTHKLDTSITIPGGIG